MNLLETVMQNPALVGQLAQNFGVGQGDAQKGLEALLPGLARGIQRNARQPGGLESLIGAIQGGGHQRYIDEPNALGQASTIQDGNGILGHILGSKDVSRNMAGHAAQKSGLDASLLKKMLPVVAAMAMGAMSKQQSGGGPLSGLAPQSAGASSSPGADLLTSFLDSDRDGSVMDDVLNLAQKFL